MIRLAAILGYVLAGFSLPGVAGAAPPVLTALFPAGGQRGTTVEVTATGTFAHWPVQGWADVKGVTVKAGREKGRLAVTIAADAAPGTCWLRVSDQEGASALRPFLIGTLPEVLEQEPNDDFKKPQPLASARLTVNGRLAKSGDVDCFAVSLHKGETLVASLEANHTLASPMDGVLQVLSSEGFVLEQNHDYHGLDPQVLFAVPRDGTYLVRTFAFPSTPDASIRFAGGETFLYRLTLTTGGFAEYASPLAVSRTRPAPVALVGWNIPEAARKMEVGPLDASNTLRVFHKDVANAVVVRVEAHPVLVQSKPNDHQHPQTIPLPVTVSGHLEKAGEKHFYRFSAKKGERLQFQIEAQALGFPLDAILRVLDGSGKQLARSENGRKAGDPELAFTPAQDGIYQLEVSDLHAEGGPRALYRLRALLPEPDYALTVASDRFLLTPGKPLDIPVTIERRQGFAAAVELHVEGLPVGVTAAPLPLAPAAKTGTLRLTAGASATSGAVRIVGKVKGKDALTRSAQTAIPGFSATTTHLWLTVPSKSPR